MVVVTLPPCHCPLYWFPPPSTHSNCAWTKRAPISIVTSMGPSFLSPNVNFPQYPGAPFPVLKFNPLLNVCPWFEVYRYIQWKINFFNCWYQIIITRLNRNWMWFSFLVFCNQLYFGSSSRLLPRKALLIFINFPTADQTRPFRVFKPCPQTFNQFGDMHEFMAFGPNIIRIFWKLLIFKPVPYFQCLFLLIINLNLVKRGIFIWRFSVSINDSQIYLSGQLVHNHHHIHPRRRIEFESMSDWIIFALSVYKSMVIHIHIHSLCVTSHTITYDFLTRNSPSLLDPKCGIKCAGYHLLLQWLARMHKPSNSTTSSVFRL